jgi:hypothetical protein
VAVWLFPSLGVQCSVASFFRSRRLERTEKKLVSKGRKIKLQRKEERKGGR